MPKNQTGLLSFKLSEVNSLLAHPLIRAPNHNHPYKDIIDTIKMELRLLQAGLTDYDPAHERRLIRWSASSRSEERLSNLKAILDELVSPQLPEEPEGKWAALSRENKEEAPHNEKAEELITTYLIDIKYSQRQVQLFGLEQLGTINADGTPSSKTLKVIKEGGYNTAYVVAQLSTPVGRIVKESINAGAQGASATTALAPGLGGFLSTLPILGSVITAGTSLYHLGNSVLKKQGYSETGQRAAMVGLAIAALVLTVLFTAYATAIGSVMVGAGVYISYVKPYIQLRAQAKGLAKESENLQLREALINTNPSNLELTAGERKVLGQKLVSYFAENEEISLEAMSEVRALIKTGNYEQISNDPMLKSALGKQSIKDFLIDNCKLDQTNLNTIIANVDNQKKAMAAQGINGIFTTLGAVFLAVPVPPLPIIGVAILLTTGLIGLGITYRKPISNFLSSVKDGVINAVVNSKKLEEDNGLAPEVSLDANKVSEVLVRPDDTGPSAARESKPMQTELESSFVNTAKAAEKRTPPARTPPEAPVKVATRPNQPQGKPSVAADAVQDTKNARSLFEQLGKEAAARNFKSALKQNAPQNDSASDTSSEEDTSSYSP